MTAPGVEREHAYPGHGPRPSPALVIAQASHRPRRQSRIARISRISKASWATTPRPTAEMRTSRAKQGRAPEPVDPRFRNLRGRDPRALHSLFKRGICAGRHGDARIVGGEMHGCGEHEVRHPAGGSRLAFAPARGSGPTTSWLVVSDFSSATVAVPASTSSLRSLTSDGPSGGKVVAAFGRLHNSEATSPSSAGTSAPETRGRLLMDPTGAPPASAVRGRASKRLAAGRKTNGAAGGPDHSTTSNSVDNQRVLAA